MNGTKAPFARFAGISYSQDEERRTFASAAISAVPLMLLEVEENLIGLVIAWIATSFICLSWGVSIRRRGRKLGRACIIAGVIHITLVVALPLLTPAKTREILHAETEQEQIKQNSEQLR